MRTFQVPAGIDLMAEVNPGVRLCLSGVVFLLTGLEQVPERHVSGYMPLCKRITNTKAATL